MSNWSPPGLPRPWLVAGAVGYALVLAYSFLIAQQVLLGVLLGGVFVVFYLLWRFLAALEAIADAQQRLADAHDGGEELDEYAGEETDR